MLLPSSSYIYTQQILVKSRHLVFCSRYRGREAKAFFLLVSGAMSKSPSGVNRQRGGFGRNAGISTHEENIVGDTLTIILFGNGSGDI